MTLTRSTANGTINRALGTLTEFSRQTKSQPSNFTDLFSLPQISLHRHSLSLHVAAFRYFTHSSDLLLLTSSLLPNKSSQ
jgi:hypothetical protein